MKCLNLTEIRFNDLSALRFVQKNMLSTLIAWFECCRPLTAILASKCIPGFAKSVFNFVLCTPILTFHTSKVCKALYTSQRFACDRERCIQGCVYTHHLRFRSIDFEPNTASSLSFLIGLILNLSFSASQDRQIISVVKDITRDRKKFPTL